VLQNLSLRSCSLCDLPPGALTGCRLRDISLVDCGLVDVPDELTAVAGADCARHHIFLTVLILAAVHCELAVV